MSLMCSTPIWILIGMVWLMTRTKSFEESVDLSCFAPPGQSDAISHLTPQSLRNWSWSVAIDWVWVWTCAQAKNGGKGQKQDVHLALFFCKGNQWSPTMGEMSPARAREELSMSSRYVMGLNISPFPGVKYQFVFMRITWVILCLWTMQFISKKNKTM